MEEQQVTDVLKVITVPGAPQHHSPVRLDITPTKLETALSPTVCLVPQVGIDLVHAVYILVFNYLSLICQKITLLNILIYLGTVALPSGAAQQCFFCLVGFLCVTRGLSFPSHICPAGSYCPGRGNSSQQASIPCSPGNMCPPGSDLQVPCMPGTYQPLPGQVRN